MEGIYSFFCRISEFVMNISKKTYRSCAIITAGVCVVSVVAFASKTFGGSGKNSCQRNVRAGVGYALKEDADEPNAVDELQDIIENQAECLQSYFLQSDITKISDYAIEYAANIKEVASVSEIEKDTVMDVEPQESVAEITEVVVEPEELLAAAPVVEAVEERVADSIVTTGGTAVEGVMNEPIEVTEEEYNILLHIVAAEAGGCDVYGQILVANVIFNRVNNNRFPDTIEEVVFQKNQFSPATSGTLWGVKITDRTVEAVDRALEGEDYSCGALFFVARKRVSEKTFNKFNTNYDWLFEHDGHDFFRFK